jgi:hypothetical protein
MAAQRVIDLASALPGVDCGNDTAFMNLSAFDYGNGQRPQNTTGRMLGHHLLDRARRGPICSRTVGRHCETSYALASELMLSDRYVVCPIKWPEIVNDVRVGNEARGGIHGEYFRAFLRF